MPHHATKLALNYALDITNQINRNVINWHEHAAVVESIK